MERYKAQLRAAEPAYRELIGRIPLLPTPPLPPEWLRCEMLERYQVLGRAPQTRGATVLEIGSGAHGISTVPLAFRGGPAGRVVAAERSRWTQFRPVLSASGLADRVWPVACDARRLPLRADGVELAVCLHGIRSLREDDNVVQILREMFRAAPRIFLAESLPLARTNAERAHLAMYDLRQEVFSATAGSRDDLPYRTLDQLGSLVESSGGVVERSDVMEVDLPHFLAYFPRSLVEAMPDGARREDLLRRWDAAERMRRQDGEDHPPVGIVTASRR